MGAGLDLAATFAMQARQTLRWLAVKRIDGESAVAVAAGQATSGGSMCAPCACVDNITIVRARPALNARRLSLDAQFDADDLGLPHAARPLDLPTH